MHPILFEAWGYKVSSYPVMMVLGYLLAAAVMLHLTPKGHGPEDPWRAPRGEVGLFRAQVWDLFVVMLVSSVIGAKIGHVLFEASGHIDANGKPIDGVIALLRDDPFHWARLGEGGYVWYGGMIGALGVAVFYFWRRPHLNRWRYADVTCPAIMAGAAVGRLGCFMAGCCHGKPTDLPIGVFMHGHMVHPTQLYDATIAGLLAVFLFFRFPRRRFDGESIATLLVCYPILRATTEFFRGDQERGALGPLSTSQWLSIPLLLIGVALFVRLRRHPVAIKEASRVAAE